MEVKRKKIIIIIFLAVFCLSGMIQVQLTIASNDEVWQVSIDITPTIDKVEWREWGEYSGLFPDSCFGPRLEDGRWFRANVRFDLVQSEYISAHFVDVFNWTLVNTELSQEGYGPYSSFEEFETFVWSNPSWWIDYSWGWNLQWLGVPLNKTSVITYFNPDTSRAELHISCQITNIPAFFLGSTMTIGRRLEPLLAGFRITELYIGSLENLNMFEFYRNDRTFYKIYFETPANLISKFEDTYTFLIEGREGVISNIIQEIRISMPSETQIQSTSPSNMANFSENIATFTVYEDDPYPESFSVTSGPQIKSFSQIFIESARSWVIEPSTWVAFFSLVAIVYTTIRGKRVWDRQKTYYRLYRSMVNLYDHYSDDFVKFKQEIEDLSKSITKYFIDNKINDTQFDKLLSRRDDLLERAKK